jgi:hypothetical protein
MRGVTRACWTLAMLLGPFRTTPVIAQAGADSSFAVQVLMTPSQFDAAGLRKLSPAELRALNAWLVTYTTTVAHIASRGSVTAAAPPTADATIETRIDGEFSGWEGETVFRLANGQIWQQASYNYLYHYAYSPSVLIYRSGAEYRMRVDGVDQTIAVRQLK